MVRSATQIPYTVIHDKNGDKDTWPPSKPPAEQKKDELREPPSSEAEEPTGRDPCDMCATVAEAMATATAMAMSTAMGSCDDEENCGVPDFISFTSAESLATDGTTVGQSWSFRSVSMDSVVTRKSVSSLSEAEERRFVAALRHMMTNVVPDVPGTSEYFRIASYHGWPSDYCSHGQETFPGWYRAYLTEFEVALRTADIELGGDGQLGLPYWDWLSNPTFPSIIRDHFSGDLPTGFLPENEEADRVAWNRRNSDRRIRRNLLASNLLSQVDACLSVEEHWRHASMRWTRGFSLESPHNSVHVSCGFPMTSVAYAAFDPVFWLHHANVDRIYQAYLDRHDDSESEFQAMQQRLERERGEENRFDAPLEPFRHPRTGELFRCQDTFDTIGLGYIYDSVELGRHDQQRKIQRALHLPTYCIFPRLDVIKLERKSYLLYVFVFATEAEASSWDLWSDDSSSGVEASYGDVIVESWLDLPNFAGAGAIFGGKGTECTNCRVGRNPYSVLVDVTSALSRVGGSQYDAAIRAMTVDEVGAVQKLEDVAHIPNPSLVGPLFEPHGNELSLGSRGGEVENLQTYLSKAGDYPVESIDGVFGPKTKGALERVQKFWGLLSDGIAGPATKSWFSFPRHDFCCDLEQDSDAYNSKEWEDSSMVRYWMGVCPGYLDRTKLLKELAAAFSAWDEVSDVQFKEVKDEAKADIQVRFVDMRQDDGETLSFGRPGSELAAAGRDYIHFDESEKWLLQGGDFLETTAPVAFQFQTVCVHQVGHVLGFGHVADKNAIMCPLYSPGKTKLSKVDRKLLVSRASF